MKKPTFPIKSVWKYNFMEELYDLDRAMEVLPVVSVDTEFPGLLVKTSRDASESVLYRNLKFSVDRTNIIQLGITLLNNDGYVYRTWEFNFKFDIQADNFDGDSIKFLKKNGLDLDLLMKYGIDIVEFSELFAQIVCKHRDLEWVTFHGVHDMAHLLSLITKTRLPKTVFSFAEMAGCVFGNVVDVKYVAALCDDLEGGELGLDKLAKKLGVVRFGGAHNAGSDSLLTACVYAAMRMMYGLVDKDWYRSYLYGISAKIERETYPEESLRQQKLAKIETETYPEEFLQQQQQLAKIETETYPEEFLQQQQQLALPSGCVPCYPVPVFETYYYVPFYET